MKSTAEPLEGNKVKLSIEVDEHEIEAAVDAVARKLARDVRIPGFRPGKAPRRLLEARMGKGSLRQEAMRESLPDFYARALRDSEVDAIAPPEIDITGGEDAGPLLFDAVVQVRPRVSVAGYQGLQVTVPGFEVTDDDIGHQIDRLRRSHGQLAAVDRPAAAGDHVTISISGRQDGEAVEALSADDFLHEVGTGGFVPELDDHLVGAKTGDIREFTSTVGEAPVSFRVLVKQVQDLVLPEVTDGWAQEASEFETVAELRDDLRTRMAMVKKVQTAMAIRDRAVAALTELVTEDPPEALVNAEMESRIHDLAHRLEAQGADLGQYLVATGQDQDSFVADLRARATEAVKADLALRALADDEAIEATDDDVTLEIERLAERMEQSPDLVRTQLERSEQLPAVRSDIRKAKALAWLVEHVEVVDEDGSPIDRADLAPPVTEAEADGEAPESDAGDVEHPDDQVDEQDEQEESE